jgi:hypothetical protein
MTRRRIVVSALLSVTVAGCGSSVTDEMTPGEDAVLTGRFTGRFTSQDQGIRLEGFLTLELEESDTNELFGSFKLEGTLDDGEFQEPIAGNGPLVGAVFPDQVANLYFTAMPDFCPQQSIEFTGSFDRRVASLVVSGPILILDSACAVLLAFPSRIPMRR